MKPMRFFIDTHDKEDATFPPRMDVANFESFFVTYEEACRAEGVVLLRVHAGLQDGRAFCLTMAEDAEAVRRAHARVGLAFTDITEVLTATPGDTFFHERRAGS